MFLYISVGWVRHQARPQARFFAVDVAVACRCWTVVVVVAVVAVVAPTERGPRSLVRLLVCVLR